MYALYNVHAIHPSILRNEESSAKLPGKYEMTLNITHARIPQIPEKNIHQSIKLHFSLKKHKRVCFKTTDFKLRCTIIRLIIIFHQLA